MTAPVRVLVLLAEGCEEIEAVTLVDILRRAEFEVVVAGLLAGPVTASRGVVLVPDTDLDSARQSDYELIVLPGGAGGAQRLREDARVLELLRRQHAAGRWLAAICAAPTVLAAAGLLEGRRATSFPGHLATFGVKGLDYREEAVVRDGRIVTSRGPGTAMDFALELVQLLSDQTRRERVEAALQRPQTNVSDWLV